MQYAPHNQTNTAAFYIGDLTHISDMYNSHHLRILNKLVLKRVILALSTNMLSPSIASDEAWPTHENRMSIHLEFTGAVVCTSSLNSLALVYAHSWTSACAFPSPPYCVFVPRCWRKQFRQDVFAPNFIVLLIRSFLLLAVHGCAWLWSVGSGSFPSLVVRFWVAFAWRKWAVLTLADLFRKKGVSLALPLSNKVNTVCKQEWCWQLPFCFYTSGFWPLWGQMKVDCPRKKPTRLHKSLHF